MPKKTTALKAISPMGSIGGKTKAAVTNINPPPPAKSQGRPLPDLAGRFTTRPRGPELLHLGQKRDITAGGPGEKPEEFPGTQPEFVWFMASIKLFNAPDPRMTGIWTGASTAKGTFTFADPIAAGVTTAREAGIATPDFVYDTPGGQKKIVRIEGFYFHVSMGATVQARDLNAIRNEGRPGDQVVRVNDSEFMDDASGAKAVALLADILENKPHVGQLQGGIAQAPRYAQFGGPYA